MGFRPLYHLLALFLVFVTGYGRLAFGAPSLRFAVTLAKSVGETPFTGRVVVYLQPASTRGEPRLAPSGLNTAPVLSREVENLPPGETVVVGGPETRVFPLNLDTLPPGDWVAQVVFDRNPDAYDVGRGTGNPFSPPVPVTSDRQSTILVADRIIPPARFPETLRFKEFTHPSEILTRFYQRPVVLRASVLLPDGYDPNGTTRYPVLYIVPGFGARYDNPNLAFALCSSSLPPLIRVILDPYCGNGYHAFADSENNGPRGQALIEEFIPALEKQFHGRGTANARLLTGHAAGGWSALWLQTTYPDTFGGVWSTAPDSPDFHDFHGLDLYSPSVNLFTDAEGKARAFARLGETPILFCQPLAERENALGRGGQLRSFEAIFSPRLPNGTPRPLWDPATGAIDSLTVRAWEKYDIRLRLTQSWSQLAPLLAGKLHLYTGDKDGFYLDGATRLLRDTLTSLKSDAVIELVPNKNHTTLLDKAMRERIMQEMSDTLVR